MTLPVTIINFSFSEKLDEVVNFIEQHQHHVLGVSEAALHGQDSRTRRVFPTTTSAIQHHLAIPGFTLILPDTWTHHDQARLIVYVKDSVSYKVTMLGQHLQYLPLITLEVWKGKNKKQTLSYFYREFTGGVLGLSTIPNQVARLKKVVQHEHCQEGFHHHGGHGP